MRTRNARRACLMGFTGLVVLAVGACTQLAAPEDAVPQNTVVLVEDDSGQASRDGGSRAQAEDQDGEDSRSGFHRKAD